MKKQKIHLVQDYKFYTAGKMWFFSGVRVTVTDASDTEIPRRTDLLIHRCIANEVLRMTSWSWGTISFLMDTSKADVALVSKYLRVSYETVEEWYNGITNIPAEAVMQLRPYFWRKIFRRKLPILVTPGEPGVSEMLYDATIRMGLAHPVESQNVVY